MMETTVRIALADDHTLVREGLRKIIEAQPGWEVVSEAADGRQAVSQALELKPDVVIVDLAMPQLSGVDAIQQIVRRCRPPASWCSACMPTRSMSPGRSRLVHTGTC
jgi:DNA-binding NarL/FixJ family response regulator